jgi:hypothetical protein
VIDTLIGLGRFAFYAIAAGWVWRFLNAGMEPHFQNPRWAIFFSAPSTLALAAAVLLWQTIVQQWVDVRRIVDMLEGRHPRDGRLAAFQGRVRPLGPPLRAALSGAECVAYEYRVKETTWTSSSGSGSRSRTLLALDGYHMTPTVLETVEGELPLLAFPDLREFRRTGLDRDRGRALEARLTGRGPTLTRLAALGRIHRAGEAAADWRYRGVRNWETARIEEWALPAGRRVCIVGVWDERARAIRSAYWRTRRGVSVYRKEAAAAVEEMSKTIEQFALLSALLLAVGAVIALLPRAPALIDRLL